MSRAEKKRKIREWYKQIRKFSLGQFEIFLESLVQEHVDEAEGIFEQALREEFGFGDKRILRLKEAAQNIYDKRVDKNDNGEREISV